MNRWTDAVWTGGPADPIERYVLLRIADRADRSGCCFPSLASIASDTRLSESTIKRALRRLASEGWLTFTPGNGRGKRSHYQILKKGSQRTPSETGKGIHTEPLSTDETGSERTPFNPEAKEERGSESPAKGFTQTAKGVHTENPPHTPPSSEPPRNPQRTPIFLQPKAANEKAPSRHSLFRESYRTWFTQVNGTAPQWKGREAKALNEFLDSHSELTLEEWQRILAHRAAGHCNPAKELSAWIKHALSWLRGPADDFGNVPKERYIDQNVRVAQAVQRSLARHHEDGEIGISDLFDLLKKPTIEGQLADNGPTPPALASIEDELADARRALPAPAGALRTEHTGRNGYRRPVPRLREAQEPGQHLSETGAIA